jgi:hypothetical protein
MFLGDFLVGVSQSGSLWGWVGGGGWVVGWVGGRVGSPHGT